MQKGAKIALSIAAGLFAAHLAQASPAPLVIGTWDFDGSVMIEPELGAPVYVPFTGSIEFGPDLTFRTLALAPGANPFCTSVPLPTGTWRLRPRPTGPGYRIRGVGTLVVEALMSCLGSNGEARRVRGTLDVLPNVELDGSFRARLRLRFGEERTRAKLTGQVGGTKRTP
jgi:hypothetical protein